MSLRKYLAGLLLALVPGVAWPIQRDMEQATLVDEADVTSAGYTYMVFGDRNALVTNTPVTGVFGPGTAVAFKAVTVGSSTTVTSNTAGQKPFQGLAVGDLLIFPQTNVTSVLGRDVEVVITTWTDAENIVVSAAVDLTGGFTFRFKKALTSTAAGGAWFSVQGFDHFNVQAVVETINSATLVFTLECRVSKYGSATTMYEKTFSAAGSDQVSVSVALESCRVGWKQTVDAGAQDVAVYIDGVR